MTTDFQTQNRPIAKRLFPLYFTPIESLFVADSRPDYPMAFIVQMAFSGKVDRAALEAALPIALNRHPFLIAYRRVAKRGMPCWVLDSGATPIVDWGTEGDRIEFQQDESFDLANEVGLRIWVRVGADRSVFTFQFHHSCCDGIGGYRFIGDLLALYGQLTDSDPSRYELSVLEPELLRNRKMRMTELAYRGQPWRLTKRCYSECFAIFQRSISPLSPAGKSHSVKEEGPYPGIVVTTFERDAHKRLGDAASKLEIGINDLLIAALFKALHDWNTQHRSRANSRWLRIMMPTDMRDAQDFGMPAANIVSYTFLTRSLKESKDAKALGPGVYRETTRIKDERRGLAFADAISGAMKYPWLLPWLTSGKRCQATAVLSNAGDPTKRFTAKFPRDQGRVVAGNLVLDDFIGVPPLRINTNVTISIITYLRKLSICSRCCPKAFSASDSRRFNEMYAQSIRELACV